MRERGVSAAWLQERELLGETGVGTRPWTEIEKRELTTSGILNGYYGRHINSVAAHLELADNPDNVQLLNRREHIEAHSSNARVPTRGPLVSRSVDSPGSRYPLRYESTTGTRINLIRFRPRR